MLSRIMRRFTGLKPGYRPIDGARIYTETVAQYVARWNGVIEKLGIAR